MLQQEMMQQWGRSLGASNAEALAELKKLREFDAGSNIVAGNVTALGIQYIIFQVIVFAAQSSPKPCTIWPSSLPTQSSMGLIL